MSRKDGQLRRGEITLKDMDVLREADRARVQAKQNHASLRDYGLQHRVEARWGMSPDAERDRMFILKVDDYEVILDAEEVRRAIRWV